MKLDNLKAKRPQAECKFLINNFLKIFVSQGRLVLPRMAPGSGLSQADCFHLCSSLRIKVTESASYKAAIQGHRIELSAGWFCGRWCASYLLLKSIWPDAVASSAELELLPLNGSFVWHESIPGPESEDALVGEANKIFPWVFMPTVLHEIAHRLELGVATGPSIEVGCDRVAADYLVGAGDFPERDVRMLGFAVWLCCLCSESLGASMFLSDSHPHPVARVREFLVHFVPPTSELGKRVWMLCVGHVLRLAKFRERGGLAEAVRVREDSDFCRLLADLQHCW